MARWTTQEFQTIDDKFETMYARTVKLEIKHVSDNSDPNSGSYRLRCIDVDVKAAAPLELGDCESLDKAQKRADELMKQNRKNPPNLKWTKVE
ncbi:MAG: hypothetical protein ACLFVU_12765 [Phycisphaerae bacterium]